MPSRVDYSIEGVPYNESAIRAKIGPCPGMGGGFFARFKVSKAAAHRTLENNLGLAQRFYWEIDTKAGPPIKEIANFQGSGKKKPWEIKSSRGGITPRT